MEAWEETEEEEEGGKHEVSSSRPAVFLFMLQTIARRIAHD